MRKKTIIPFFVIIDNPNKQEFVTYDIMPYLIECYKAKKKKDRPMYIDDFKEFIRLSSLTRFWSRCEYEIVLKAWVSKTKEKKIDAHTQIMNNIDVVTTILMKNVLSY